MPRPQRLTPYASLGLVTCLVLLLSLSVLTASAVVTFSDFAATKQSDGSIKVVWTTASESNTAAFNLYRAAEATVPLDDVHLIHQEPAIGSGNTGATYAYTDTATEPGMCYYYMIAELTYASSIGSQDGPVAAGDNCSTADTTPTATRTATATTAAGVATATATKAATSVTSQATATRQFANTPTTAPTITPGPGVTWTPAPAPGATPLPGAQIATPTPATGAGPAATNPAPIQAQVPTAVPTRQPEPSATATRTAPTEVAAPPRRQTPPRSLRPPPRIRRSWTQPRASHPHRRLRPAPAATAA